MLSTGNPHREARYDLVAAGVPPRIGSGVTNDRQSRSVRDGPTDQIASLARNDNLSPDVTEGLLADPKSTLTYGRMAYILRR